MWGYVRVPGSKEPAKKQCRAFWLERTKSGAGCIWTLCQWYWLFFFFFSTCIVLYWSAKWMYDWAFPLAEPFQITNSRPAELRVAVVCGQSLPWSYNTGQTTKLQVRKRKKYKQATASRTKEKRLCLWLVITCSISHEGNYHDQENFSSYFLSFF